MSGFDAQRRYEFSPAFQGRGPRAGSPRGVAGPGKANEVSASRSDVCTWCEFNRRYATRTRNNLMPALKRRAKLIPTLRVEEP